MRKHSRVVRSNPNLWESIKNKWIRGSKAGSPGKISARKMQLAVQEYKRRGGRYIGGSKQKTSLAKWTREDWGYVGKPRKSRYLPAKVRKSLSPREKRIENRRKGSRLGKWVPYSSSVKRKMKKLRIF
jgi:hypothetical protein